MKIEKDTVVSLEYSLLDNEGNLIERGDEAMVYLHGNYDNTLPKIEAALEGREVGDKVQLVLEPEEGFGEYDAQLVRTEKLSNLPSDIKVGMEIEATDEEDFDDEDEPLIFTVTDIADGMAVLDGNHPFAGMTLRFSASVLAIRPATAVEIEHQHPHLDDDETHQSDIVEKGDSNDDHYRSFRLN